MTAPRYPRIGVAVVVQRGAQVLLGKRRSDSHGDGVWQFPGGHLEWGETVDDCARREALEETGLRVVVRGYGPWTNDVFAAEDKHYVTLFVLTRSTEGDPQLREPDKCEQWGWYEWGALPEPLFLPIRHLFDGGWSPPHV